MNPVYITSYAIYPGDLADWLNKNHDLGYKFEGTAASPLDDGGSSDIVIMKLRDPLVRATEEV